MNFQRDGHMQMKAFHIRRQQIELKADTDRRMILTAESRFTGAHEREPVIGNVGEQILQIATDCL